MTSQHEPAPLLPLHARPHVTHNANRVHEAELSIARFNRKLAILLTEGVGSMWVAYSFAVLALTGLLAILGLFPPLIAVLVAWTSQTFIQLIFLPILSVGQGVLSRKAELQAEEQYKATMNGYHDIEHILLHLDVVEKRIDYLIEQQIAHGRSNEREE